MTKLTAVIITANEEKNIERCLASLSDVADEIVVMDSFSTDRTEQICREYNVLFFQQQWKGYGQQKNDANNKASNDFILSIDADEALSDILRDAILKEKQRGLSGIYEMKRLNNFCGNFIKYGSWNPDKKIRIFNRTEVQWNTRLVHEDLEMTKNPELKLLKGDLLHYTCSTIGEYINTINKYTTLGAQAYFEKGKRSSVVAMLFKPCVGFINSYFFRLGFLDGTAGFMLAKIIAFEAFLKYSKLYHLQKNK